jgi:uncharacterized protein (DUF2267 family)
MIRPACPLAIDEAGAWRSVMDQNIAEPFATTVQESSLWLQSIADRVAARGDKDLSWAVLGAALHALRDRLQPGAALHLGAQLPMLIRGLYYEHWRINPQTGKERHQKQFLDHVRQELPSGRGIDAEAAVRAVFGVMHEKIDPGEIAKLTRQLPKELRELWPAST